MSMHRYVMAMRFSAASSGKSCPLPALLPTPPGPTPPPKGGRAGPGLLGLLPPPTGLPPPAPPPPGRFPGRLPGRLPPGRLFPLNPGTFGRSESPLLPPPFPIVVEPPPGLFPLGDVTPPLLPLLLPLPLPPPLLTSLTPPLPIEPPRSPVGRERESRFSC